MSENEIKSLQDEDLSSVAGGVKSNTQLAYEVIEGLWGDGEDRKRRLARAGYDYYAIQPIVNRILKDQENRKNPFYKDPYKL